LKTADKINDYNVGGDDYKNANDTSFINHTSSRLVYNDENKQSEPKFQIEKAKSSDLDNRRIKYKKNNLLIKSPEIEDKEEEEEKVDELHPLPKPEVKSPNSLISLLAPSSISKNRPRS